MLPGYEYDIFISYRHNDNKSGWVTEFVNALQEELAATIKEPLSVYFDSNPHDGLLETHNVDKSLEGKLKCLIFIPILSQTYCDPKSFAWQHEFVVFNKSAKEDQFGRDIKLNSGNVTSRILPIKIHDLDADDKATLENEIGGILRAIEFIYKEAGVNRPLRLNEDNPNKNQNQTTYRNQVNKVANAIKDIIVGIKNQGANDRENKKTEITSVSPSFRKKTSLIASVLIIMGIAFAWFYYQAGWGEMLASTQSKSIAVLPFENMNKDSTQDYFSNGMSEDILNHLVKIADLRVKSRTSTLQYKGTTKTAPQIGEELGVANIVEGSVRRVGDKVRIVVQLIDAQKDEHLWSETYDRDFKDVLSLQSEIAIEISKALEAKLTESEKQGIEKKAAADVSAYDYYLKARELGRRANGKRVDIENALALCNKAIEQDRTFAEAYSLKAWLWINMSALGLPESMWRDSANYNADKSIELDRTEGNGYMARAWVHRYLGKIKQANDDIRLAFKEEPNNPDVQSTYGNLLLSEGKEEGADFILKANREQYSPRDLEYFYTMSAAYFFTEDNQTALKLAKQVRSLNPDNLDIYLSLASIYNRIGQPDKAIEELKAAEKINPDLPWTADNLAWTYFRKKDYDNAIKYWSKYPEFESQFEDTTQIIPFRHRLAMAYSKTGRKKEGDKLVKEDLRIQTELLNKKRGMGAWSNFGSIYYDLAVDNAYLENDALAVQCLDSAFHYEFFAVDFYGKDPIFENLKDRADFKKVAGKMGDWFQFRKRAFSNALNRAKASKELKGLRDR